MSRLLTLLAVAAVVLTVLLAPRLRDFRVDASTDSLVLEHDPESARYDRTGLTFATDEFVLVGLNRPDLFSPAGLAAVSSLHQAFAAIEGVQGVDSILTVPLFRSFTEELDPFAAAMQQATIASPGIDLDKARAELTEHEFVAGNLISADGRTAGFLVTLRALPESVEATQTHVRLIDGLAAAQAAAAAAPEDAGAREQLQAAHAALAAHRPTWDRTENARKGERIRIVKEVRAIVEEARSAGADINASGVPSIVVEMVEAIDADLRLFTGLSLGFILLFLALVFRRIRWVLLPLLAIGSTVVITVVVMLAVGKQVTVITSNVPSLLMVIGLAHSIHMIVRYREHLVRYPDEDQPARIRRLIRELVWPCLFTATTTGAGFVSLYYAGSRPIIDFGFLMALGVGLAFLLSFLILPGFLLVLPRRAEGRLERSAQALQGLGRLALRRRLPVVLAAALVTGLSVWGILRLQVEARFIDYFAPSSPIHQGLKFIDDRLGGTSGLEVILISEEAGAFGFMRPQNLDRAAEVVAWMEERHEIGAVLSYVGLLDELRKTFTQANRGMAARLIANFSSPETVRPYVVVEEKVVAGESVPPFSQVRITARARETDPQLRRGQLLSELRAYLAEAFPPPADGAEGPPPVRAEVTGMFVLYANMLASLVDSQVQTSLLALSAIFLMLALLFRSPTAALLGVIPNLIPITFVMGCMGWAGIPLDMATVMIASVSLGIGVDCAIHYLFRYRDEVAQDGDVQAAILRSHGSIGTSILYTSLTSVVGFAVLAGSAFLPNAYFGIFTGFAMVAALFAMLTVLPVLILWFRPFRAAMRAGQARAAQGGAEPESAADAPPPAAA